MEILNVTESCKHDHVFMTVNEDISINSDGSKYAERCFVFRGVTEYLIDEGPVADVPIVNTVIHQTVTTKYGPKYKITLNTNAGIRCLYYDSFNE